MSQYDAKQIEEYQLILLKNPRSPVFAALSEAYRKMGLLEEALEVTSKGIKHNPEFTSGLVAHAKVLYQAKEFHQAEEVLVKAHALKPENILAMRLLGSCYLKMRKPHKALKTFKKLLVADPQDETALSSVKKWEFLDNVFNSDDLQSLDEDKVDQWVRGLPSAEHALDVIDSFVNAGDDQAAARVTQTACLVWPSDDSLVQRDRLLSDKSRGSGDQDRNTDKALRQLQIKRDFLENCLQRITLFKGVDHRQRP